MRITLNGEGRRVPDDPSYLEPVLVEAFGGAEPAPLDLGGSTFPGSAYWYPYSARRLANCCHSSPGIFPIMDPLP